MHATGRISDPKLVLAVLCASLACSTTDHTPEPYRSDPVAGAELSARAAGFCVAENPDAPPPVKPFLTDGCSRVIDAEWNIDCCIEHDIRYWCGGSAEQREAADRAFGACVTGHSAAIVGEGMELGVRVGGHPVWPTGYRWGYGHEYSGGYPDTSRD
jgi:hypothetical protein